MWKKFREASSGVTFTSVTNLLRGRSYSKFSEENEINDDHGTAGSVLDQDNNVITWTKNTQMSDHNDFPVRDSTVQNDDSSDDEYGFENNQETATKSRFHVERIIQIVQNKYRGQLKTVRRCPREHLDDSGEFFNDREDDFASSQSKGENTNGVFHKAGDVHQNIKQPNPSLRNSLNSSSQSNQNVLIRTFENGHSVPNPKKEVKQLVDSFSQRRYQQLEESDESIDSRSSTAESAEIENITFHKAEDVHEDIRHKSSKLKGTKKPIKYLSSRTWIPHLPVGKLYAVLACLDTAQELWIRQKNGNSSMSRMLRERALHLHGECLDD
ncbi:ACTR8 [Mytilus edulis]|uniref:ACTR8 n=1 Tax=Mytilus edulis TaxID=6550 RepID=A0A8S3TLC3_MYTED|nr:ACTR8 [Mytilus edulis]